MVILNRLKIIRRVLYRMKHRYGATIEYYRPGELIVDEQTGVATQSRTRYDIKRAVCLPDRRLRELLNLTASEPYTQGGSYGKGGRDFLIDAKDISIKPNDGDYIVKDGVDRFNIVEVVDLDNKSGYWVITESIESIALERLFSESVTDTLNLTDGVT